MYHPTHEEIAAVAKKIWIDEGCPEGRDKIHWRWAVQTLENRQLKIRSSADHVRAAVVSGLQSCIEVHGPVTREFIESAAKRIMAQLFGANNAARKVDRLASAIARAEIAERREKAVRRELEEERGRKMPATPIACVRLNMPELFDREDFRQWVEARMGDEMAVRYVQGVLHDLFIDYDGGQCDHSPWVGGDLPMPWSCWEMVLNRVKSETGSCGTSCLLWVTNEWEK